MEFALILPLVMMLILGMFTGGLAYNQKLSVTQAAREGARYGATVPVKQMFTGPRPWAEGIADLVVERAAGDLADNKQVVCVALVEGPRNAPTVVPADPAGNVHVWKPGADACPFAEGGSTDNPGRRVQVAIKRPGEIELLVSKINLSITSRANAQYEPRP